RRPRHESDGSIIGGALALRIATPFWRNCNCCGGRPLARDVDVGSYWFFRRVGRDEVVAGNSRRQRRRDNWRSDWLFDRALGWSSRCGPSAETQKRRGRNRASTGFRETLGWRGNIFFALARDAAGAVAQSPQWNERLFVASIG